MLVLYFSCFKVRPNSRLCFDFSLPVDTSQLGNEEEKGTDASAAVLRPSSGIFQLVHEDGESAKEDSGEEGDDDEAEDEDEEEEDDDDDEDVVDQALDFSWTKVVPKQVAISDLVEEEAVEKTFTAPTVVSLEVLQDGGDDQDQFTFGAPHNESTISERESEGGEVEPEVSETDGELEVVDKQEVVGKQVDVKVVDKKPEEGLAESTEDDDASEKEAAEEVPTRRRTSSRKASTSPLGRSTSKLRSTSSPLTPKRSASETASHTPPPSSSRQSSKAASSSTAVTPSRRSTRRTSGASPSTPPVNTKKNSTASPSARTESSKRDGLSSPSPSSPGATSTRSTKRKSLSSPRNSSPTPVPKSSTKRSTSSPLVAATQSSTRRSARGKASGTEPQEQILDVGVKGGEKQKTLERAETLPMEVEAAEVAAVAENIEEREGSAASTVIMESNSSKASVASTEVMEVVEEEASAVSMESSVNRCC